MLNFLIWHYGYFLIWKESIVLNQNPDEFVLKQIKNLCNERNWSLYRLSMESSIPYSTLNNLFRRGNVPSISTLCKICDAFRISLSEFFSGNNDALSSLNPEQQNLIGCWNLLSKEDKNLVKAYIAGLLKKLPE